MLNIVCFSLSCLQMQLGFGWITTQATNGFLYRTPNTTFFCRGSSGIYHCLDLNNPRMAARLASPNPSGFL